MEIGRHWDTIREIFQRSIRSSLHVAIGTVNEDGCPHLTPVGGFFLRENKTGFYFDVFSVNMAVNFKHSQRICVLAVDSDINYWATSFMTGRCGIPPSVRLMGTGGERRKATQAEIDQWYQHVEFAKGTKGYDILWKDMRFVRDIYFDSFKPVYMGDMTEEYW